MKLRFIEVSQPIGTFYLVSIPANTLFNMVEVRRHDVESFDGVQRELSKKRVYNISKFCYESDAVFPTAIVVSVDKRVPYNIDFETHTIYVPSNTIIGDVIDGQHRLWGIKESNMAADFDLPIVLMFNLELAEKAYVFSIINCTQARVNKSLIYNLFGLSLTRSPYKTCHEIARALNNKNGSPFYRRMKMLGKKELQQFNANLSQGTFVQQLLKLISKDPDEDTRIIKQGKELLPYSDLPLRQFFINGNDDIIMKIIENCFSALRRTFQEEWLHSNNNILWKTTGFCAVMLVLNSILRLGMKEKDLRADFFEKVFLSFKEYIQNNGISLTSKDFPGGGEQNQKRLCRIIMASISELETVRNSKSVSSANDFLDFLSDISASIDIHEKYEFTQILKGYDAELNFFTVKKYGNEITIKYPYADVSISIQTDQLPSCIKLVEDKWFCGLDADSWYGYKLALNKDD